MTTSQKLSDEKIAALAARFDHHGPEYRVGFYFKDINEFGLYGLFAGNGDDTITSYYRTDRTFQKEEHVFAWDD